MARYLLLFFLFPLSLKAQFTYVLDQSIPASDINDNLLTMPWAGGINAAQHNTFDLNGDTKMDLVLFDRMANKVLTYINNNNQYVYAPEYEPLFPKDMSNWVLLRDYNCDGKKDLFTGDVLGMKVYTNTTQPGENLSWKQVLFFTAPGESKSPVLLTKGFSGLVNLQLQYDDLPSIVDMDGDGDLDIMCMRFVGNGTAEYHKNFSKERYGTCDSLDFERISQAWGNFTECTCGNFAFNGLDCPPPGGRIEHAGGKSVLVIDIDGDADMDLLFSEASCTKLYLLENKGTTESPVINSVADFPSSNPIDFYIFPATYYEDVDFDGVKDLIATPNIYSKTSFAENLAASNWLFHNAGSDQSPNFVLAKENFLQDKMIDVGDNAVPAFADYDGDGDYDLFISQNSSTNFRSAIYLYENTGSKEVPRFKLITNDYLGFSFSNLYNLKIQFTDITGDNKIDLVYSATSFQGVTKIYYLPNVFNYSGQLVEDINFTLAYTENIYFTDAGGSSDGKPDGKPDILVGRSNGAIEYWENTGSLNFVLKSVGFLGFKSSVLRQNPTCAVGDLDNDGRPDFVLGDQHGVLTIVNNFQKATDTSEKISDIILSPLEDSVYISRNLGGRIWPTVVNLFNTDKPAIVVGNSLGGIQILRHDEGWSLSGDPVIQIYPNPVEQSGQLQIKTDRNVFLQVFSLLGQKINEPVLLKGNKVNSYEVNGLARGLYLFRFTYNKKSYTKRVVIY